MSQRSGRGGPRQVGQSIAKVARPSLERYGFAGQDVLLRWPEIVGPGLARNTLPERLVFPRGQRSGGVLHLKVEAAHAPAVQHLAPAIVERVNVYFGYAAVARLQLHQGPLPRPVSAVRPPAPAVDAGVRAEVAALAATTRDADLRSVLCRLGEAAIGRPSGGR